MSWGNFASENPFGNAGNKKGNLRISKLPFKFIVQTISQEPNGIQRRVLLRQHK